MSNSNGSGPAPEDDRRSFTSRTPVNENPDGVQYRRGFVTRHQVTGWRFVMRRIASGVALHDTRMLVDPLRTQSRSVMFGVLLVITGLIGCLLFSWFRPGGNAGDEPILADQSTAALYVRIGDQLHPVLNLTSARLITGRAENPKTVKSAALDEFARGNLVGIPGAPERMVQNPTRDADWTVCDAVSGPAPGVTVIAGPPQTDGERASAMAADHVVLVESSSPDAAGTWLLWDGRRSPIDLADRAVTTALGLGVDATPRTIDAGLFNTVPQAPALAAPVIEAAGQPPQFALPEAAPVGAVVTSYTADSTLQHYVVLVDGLQPISPVLATLLRNTNSFGLDQPPQLGADEVAALPTANGIDTSLYPEQRVTVVGAASDPVTCAQWTKAEGASESSLTLLSGSALPLPDGRRTVDLVGAGTGGTATRIAMTPGSGYFVQTVGQEPGSTTAGSLFWVSDTGVRYGIDTEGDQTGSGDVVAALGLSNPPLPIPWAALTLFAPGPTLSRADALLAHDGLATGVQAEATGENP